MNKVMDRLEVALGDYPPKAEPFIAMKATDRQAIIELLEEVKGLHGENGCFTIAMPCGQERVFRETEDIPTGDLSCPCGNEGYYLIRYGKE